MIGPVHHKTQLSWIDVLAVQGMSSLANRSILNQAVASMRNARILEIGSWKGSTSVAMCFENSVECIHMVDNHSEFGDTRSELRATCERFGLPATIHDFDWFAPLREDTFSGTKFDVYLYDGPHQEEHHAAELAIAWPYLADSFLYIVDDYSWEKVRRGCDAGMLAHAAKMRVLSRHAYPSVSINDAAGYWNGLMVARCEKRFWH
jgi:hypothetical protein